MKSLAANPQVLQRLDRDRHVTHADGVEPRHQADRIGEVERGQDVIGILRRGVDHGEREGLLQLAQHPCDRGSGDRLGSRVRARTESRDAFREGGTELCDRFGVGAVIQGQELLQGSAGFRVEVREHVAEIVVEVQKTDLRT